MILIYVWNEYLFATTFMTGAENYTLAAGLYSLQATEMSGSWPILQLLPGGQFADSDCVLCSTASYDFRFDCRWCQGLIVSKWEMTQ